MRLENSQMARYAMRLICPQFAKPVSQREKFHISKPECKERHVEERKILRKKS